MSKKENYEYLEMLFSKQTKEEVLEQLTLKCEELLNLRNAYEKLTIEDMKKANIINELEKLITQYSKNEYYYKYDGKYLKSEIIGDIKNIFELKENKCIK